MYCPVQRHRRGTFCRCAREGMNLRLIINSGTLWNLSASVTYFLWPRIQVNDSERQCQVYTVGYVQKRKIAMWTRQVKHIPTFSFLEPGAREWSGGRWYWWGFQKKTHLCQSPCTSRKEADRLWWTWLFSSEFFYFLRRIGEWEY